MRDTQFMSQDDLARAAGVSESTIRRMENRMSHRGNVKKVAKVLGVEPRAIVEFEDPKLESQVHHLADD